MSEIKFCWNNELLHHSNYHFYKEKNISEDFKSRIANIRENLNDLLKINNLTPFKGCILLFNNTEREISGFACPFLNIINISSEVFNINNNDALLWLILHEYMHILEAEIISQVNIQYNFKLNYFNKMVQYWLNNSVNCEIKIKENVLNIVNTYVYEYNNIVIDWNIGLTFRDKFGEMEYKPLDLIQTYSNLLRDNGETSIIPDEDEGLEYLLDCFIKYLNHWSRELSNEDLSNSRSKIISIFLLHWTLYKLYLECIRNTRDPYCVLSDARAIYFSSILIGKEIEDFQRLFPIDDCKIYEANRLQNLYGNEFEFENFINTLENERLSNEAREMAFRSSFGFE